MKKPQISRHTLIRRLAQTPSAFIAFCGFTCQPFHHDWFTHQLKHPRTLILAPRGHGKTSICIIAFALYRILFNPNIRILLVSATHHQAAAFSADIQRRLLTQRTINLFGYLRGEKWTETAWTVRNRSKPQKEHTLTAMGVLGPIVGRHYDCILLDDIVNEDTAYTKTQRDKIDTWFRKVLLPCLEPHGEIHIVGTRYHHDDLYGRILTRGGYETLISRALDPEPLWPQYFSRAKLEAIKRELGSTIFALQYQNDASLAKGAIIKPTWLRYYDTPPPDGYTVAAFDLAISQKSSADFFAWCIARRVGQNYYILDADHDRLTFDQQARFIERIWHDYSPDRIRIETTAYQEALAQHLAGKGLPIERVKPDRDKVRRVMRVSPLFENGQVYLPRGLHDFEEELLTFPHGVHDDIVDAMEMALSGLMRAEIAFATRMEGVEYGTPAAAHRGGSRQPQRLFAISAWERRRTRFSLR